MKTLSLQKNSVSVNIGLRELCNPKLSGLHTFDNKPFH